MKFMFYACWLGLLFIYFGMSGLSDMKADQSLLELMDVFLAVLVPVGFAKSTISYVKRQQQTFIATLYALGFLLIFTFSQVMHSVVGGLTSDTLVMSQDPPIQEEITRLVDKALFADHAGQRAKAATLLYMVSGVKTMYKSEDGQYDVFTPNHEEEAERRKWKSSETQVGAIKDQLLEQVIAVIHRSMFHMVTFFFLFSATFLFDIYRSNSMSHL